MSYRITGLDPEPFRHLFGLPDDELARLGVERRVADAKPSFPDRIEVRDAEPGETLLLLNYLHQPAEMPYRASHAIFVREGAHVAYDQIDQIPDVLLVRPISLRAPSTPRVCWPPPTLRRDAASKTPFSACSSTRRPPMFTPTTPSPGVMRPGSIGRKANVRAPSPAISGWWRVTSVRTQA
jgi:hypothetical protein